MITNSSLNFDARLKLLQFLAMLYCTINLIGVPMAYKIIVMGPLVGPGGLAVLPLIFLLEDTIVELYGYKISRYLLWLILMSTLIFSLACVAIVHLPSPPYWHLQKNYDIVFNPILKSAPCAVLSISVGRFLNIILMSKWKILLKGRYFWIRSVFSTLISSLIALTIFFVLSFWGTVSFAVIKQLYAADMLIRLIYTMIGGIPVAFLIRYLKKNLGIDASNEHVNFNPFSLDTKD